MTRQERRKRRRQRRRMQAGILLSLVLVLGLIIALRAGKEREHILSEDTVYFSTAPYNESVDMIIGNHYFCKIF